jgi:hypothetical protein
MTKIIEQMPNDATQYPWLKICNWTQEEYHWVTSCGKDFLSTGGTPKENDMNYCPFCGAILMQGEFKEKE